MADKKLLIDRVKKLRDGIQSHTKVINPSAPEKQTCNVIEKDGVKIGAYETNDGDVVSSWSDPNYRDVVKDSINTSPSQIADELENDGDEVNEEKVNIGRKESLKKGTFSYTDAHNPDMLKKAGSPTIERAKALLSKKKGNSGQQVDPENIQLSDSDIKNFQVSVQPTVNLVKRALAVCAGDIDILAQAVGVTDQSVYKWMMGETKPSTAHEQAIRNFLTSGKRSTINVDTLQLQGQDQQTRKPQEKKEEENDKKKPMQHKPEEKKPLLSQTPEKKPIENKPEPKKLGEKKENV
jgi:hypothetical protein